MHATGRIFVREGKLLEGMHIVARGRVLLLVNETTNTASSGGGGASGSASGSSANGGSASGGGGGGGCAGMRFAGGFVGEEALLHDDRRAPWTCMAADWSELLLLRGADFRSLARQYPELHQRVAFSTHGKEGKFKDDVRPPLSTQRPSGMCNSRIVLLVSLSP